MTGYKKPISLSNALVAIGWRRIDGSHITNDVLKGYDGATVLETTPAYGQPLFSFGTEYGEIQTNRSGILKRLYEYSVITKDDLKRLNEVGHTYAGLALQQCDTWKVKPRDSESIAKYFKRSEAAKKAYEVAGMRKREKEESYVMTARRKQHLESLQIEKMRLLNQLEIRIIMGRFGGRCGCLICPRNYDSWETLRFHLACDARHRDYYTNYFQLKV